MPTDRVLESGSLGPLVAYGTQHCALVRYPSHGSWEKKMIRLDKVSALFNAPEGDSYRLTLVTTSVRAQHLLRGGVDLRRHSRKVFRVY